MSLKLKVYRNDIKTKGLYWSIIHRIYKLPRIKKVITPLINNLKPTYITLYDAKLYIDKNDEVVSQQLLQNGKWEPYETEIFKKSIKKGDTVVDIGAHIGYYTIIAAKIVGPKGRVYAFEPNPNNFKLLSKTIATNQYSNVILVKKAVSDKTGKIKLYINTQNTGDHRVFNSHDDRKSITIETVKLDDFFSKNEKIDLIKMDIQGSEHNTLKGGRKLLTTNKNISIITELEPELLKLNNTSAKKFLDLLGKLGFRFYDINEQKKKTSPTTSEELIELYPPLPFMKANILCKKSGTLYIS